jgi:hypothetical protein
MLEDRFLCELDPESKSVEREVPVAWSGLQEKSAVFTDRWVHPMRIDVVPGRWPPLPYRPREMVPPDTPRIGSQSHLESILDSNSPSLARRADDGDVGVVVRSVWPRSRRRPGRSVGWTRVKGTSAGSGGGGRCTGRVGPAARPWGSHHHQYACCLLLLITIVVLDKDRSPTHPHSRPHRS